MNEEEYGTEGISIDYKDAYECIYCGYLFVHKKIGVCPKCKLMPIPPFEEETKR